jgi:hypothetical protein
MGFAGYHQDSPFCGCLKDLIIIAEFEPPFDIAD